MCYCSVANDKVLAVVTCAQQAAQARAGLTAGAMGMAQAAWQSACVQGS
jgi:hypothetical protein